jgi:hypothetical protein
MIKRDPIETWKLLLLLVIVLASIVVDGVFFNPADQPDRVTVENGVETYHFTVTP